MKVFKNDMMLSLKFSVHLWGVHLTCTSNYLSFHFHRIKTFVGFISVFHNNVSGCVFFCWQTFYKAGIAWVVCSWWPKNIRDSDSAQQAASWTQKIRHITRCSHCLPPLSGYIHTHTQSSLTSFHCWSYYKTGFPRFLESPGIFS